MRTLKATGDVMKLPILLRAASKYPSEVSTMGFWLGIGASQAAGGQPAVKRRYPIIISVTVGVLVALLIFVGLLVLLSVE
jgi:hypothetical protein